MPFEKTSRRTFLKMSSLATAFVVGLPELVVSEAKAMEPAPERKRIVLFQGDSITDCGRSRDTDRGAVMGQGYPVLVTSRLMADNPGINCKFFNRGISGNKLVDLQARWQRDTVDLLPDILSILIGVNDVAAFVGGNAAMSAERFEADYTSILDQTFQNLPSVKLVLCEPFLLPSEKQKKWSGKYEVEIAKRQEITRKLAQKYHAVFVPFQEPLSKACSLAPPEYWVYDAVHPSFAGHELLAREWVKAAGSLFTSGV
jgi:lysophospholipase L1-like esterase